MFKLTEVKILNVSYIIVVVQWFGYFSLHLHKLNTNCDAQCFTCQE